MKKILYITPQLPYPPISGGRIKTLSTIKSLIDLNSEITLFTFIENKEDIKYVEDLKKIGVQEIFTLYNKNIGEKSRIKQLLMILQSFFSIKPYGFFRYFDKRLKSRIEEYLSNNKPDIVWTNFLYMAQYLPNNWQGLKVLESHDVESLLYKSAFRKGMFLHLKLLYFYEWIKYTIYEKIIYKKFNIIFAISNRDKLLLEKIIKRKKVFVLPPNIEIKKTNKNIKREENSMLFTGTLFWYPNKDGITWFLREVFPLIRAKIPSIKLWIIGKYSPNFKPVQMEGVKFLGFVDNIEVYMDRAQVFIVPIRYGTGVRIKILEAMSWGIPVVSTYEGIYGLDVKDGHELLIARDEREFVEKVILLLENEKLQEKLVKDAFKFIYKNFSYKELEETLKLRS